MGRALRNLCAVASVKANGITIEYDERGDGIPMLLVMGLGAQLTDWPPALVDELAGRGYRVITFDNRDSGLSTEMQSVPPTIQQLARAFVFRRDVPAEYRLSDMAADACGLLDALGIGEAHVVGASMGGMIAQTMAIESGPRVRSMTSIMSTTGSRRVGQPTPSVIRRWLRRPAPSESTAVDVAVETFRHICGPTFDEDEFRALAEASVARSYRPAGTARQLAAVAASGDRTEALGRVAAPTLVVHGLVDPLVRPSGGIATAKAISGSRLLMFDDMGHDLPSTRTVELADAIVANAKRA